jgi:cell division septal protein FtsQ
MRDYKNVKVPRRYRTTRKKTSSTKRLTAGPVRGRKRTGRLKDAAVTVLSVLITLALCYGAWAGYRWLTTAEMFQVAGIDVAGAVRITDGGIRSVADQFTGKNIFRVDIAGAAREAEANPWVRDVRIERRLPNRIRMVFQERVPRAVLQAANGRYLMDGEGVVIVPAREGEEAAAGLPAIVLGDRRVEPREAVDSEALPSVLALLDELALRGGWDPASVTIRAGTPETIAIRYAGHEFRMGRGNYAEKLRRLGEIVSDMNRRGREYAYIDLRPERQAAVGIVDAGTGARGRGPGAKKRS